MRHEGRILAWGAHRKGQLIKGDQAEQVRVSTVEDTERFHEVRARLRAAIMELQMLEIEAYERGTPVTKDNAEEILSACDGVEVSRYDGTRYSKYEKQEDEDDATDNISGA